MNAIVLPELLAPAGGMPQLEAALRFGADAIYVGMPRYGLRAYADNFDLPALKEAVHRCHDAGKKLYVTLNIFAFDEDMDGLLESARLACDAGVDAAIVADIGVLTMIHEHLPQWELHISTQANTTNTCSTLTYHALGAKRIVLAREMSLEQIAAMRRKLSAEIELEAFVHGAVCMSYSGRCLLSSYIVGRSGNRGACAQPCRWFYEEKRPDDVFMLEEDERGSYLLSARDLCMIEHIPLLCQSGIASLKIEGRMKTEYYVATVVGAYRRALDAYAADPESYGHNEALHQALLSELYKASHRTFDTGFYFGMPKVCGDAGGFEQDAEFVARVLEVEDARMTLEVKNRFFADDPLEALTPNGVIAFTPGLIRLVETGELLRCINRPKAVVSISRVPGVTAGDLLRGPCRNHQKV